MRVNAVRFSPGARTAWHSHAVGQTLYVTEGRGLVPSRGGGVVPIRSGDVVHTPADEWHWHGAQPDHGMTHLSITEGTAPGDERPETDWGSTPPTGQVLHRLSEAEIGGQRQRGQQLGQPDLPARPATDVHGAQRRSGDPSSYR